MSKFEKPLNLLLVENLVNANRRILVLEFGGVINYWLVVVKFESATLDSDPVNFSQLEGSNITEFVNMHTGANSTELDSLLNAFLQKKPIMKVNVSPNTYWQYFSISGKNGTQA